METSDVLQLVIDFIGLSPSRFYLRECSRYFHREISQEIHLSKEDFFYAVGRNLINPKFLKLKVRDLSYSLIKKLLYEFRPGTRWSFPLESLVEGRPMDELLLLNQRCLKTILECSILRMNVSLFDIAMKCIETRGCEAEVVPEVLKVESVQAALMKADGLEWLERMIENVSAGNVNDLLVCAVEFRAQRCVAFLRGFTSDWEAIPGMRDAVVYAGDLANVKTLYRNASAEELRRAFVQAVRMRHFEVAAFLRAELNEQGGSDSLMKEVLLELARTREPDQEDLSMDLVSLIFEGIYDLANCWIGDITLLEIACRSRFRTMCYYLVEHGCTCFTMQYSQLVLARDDLVGVIDLICGLKDGVDYNEDPSVELFLVTRGVQLPKRRGSSNPVTDVVWEGFQAALFSNRVELIKYYLMKDRKFATNIVALSTNFGPFSVTPLGALELIGTPRIVTWTGRKSVSFAESISGKKEETPATDEWTRTRKDEIEIQALRDIRTLLLAYGANAEVLVGYGSLSGD